MRRGEPTRRSISGSSAWICATMPPIGSSTSGSQISSWSLMARKDTGRLRRDRHASCAATPKQQDGEQAPEHVLRQRASRSGRRRRHRRSTPRPSSRAARPADVAVVPLPPRARRDGRQDRQQRRRLGVDLRQAQARRASARRGSHRRRRRSRREARRRSRGRSRRRPWPRSSRRATRPRAPRATRRTRVSATRPETRCWTPVPTTAPAAAGRPTSAA